MGHPAFPHLQRSTASCHRSRSPTAQPTTSPPATTWWTSACRPPPTDRNPTSCSAARTCDRPRPARAPVRLRVLILHPPLTALRAPAPSSPSLRAWLLPSHRAPHGWPGPRKNRSRVAPAVPLEESQPPGSPHLLFSGPSVHLGGPGRVAGWTGSARGKEEGHAEQASPVFHGRLQGAVASLPLWPVGPTGPPTPTQNPLPSVSSKSKAPGGRGRRTLMALGSPAPHAQPALAHAFDLSRACAAPAPACRFMLGEDPSPPSPSFCTQRALQPLLVPLSVLSPVWSGTCCK